MKIPLSPMILGWKSVRPDLRTRGDFRWPYPGNWAQSDYATQAPNSSACPSLPGDGLCIAKTYSGAAQGGYPIGTTLLLAYSTKDILGEDAEKVRVRRAFVLDVIDHVRCLRETPHRSADLRGADLRGADLRGADLRGANLYGAIGYRKETQ